MAPARKQRRYGFWLILLLLIAAPIAYFMTRPEKILTVSLVAVEKGSVEEAISPVSSGEIFPRARTTLNAESSGIIKELRKRKGDTVVADEVILRLDTAEIQARIAQSNAGVLSAKSVLRQAVLRVDSVRPSRERAEKLLAEGASTESELERVDSEYKIALEAVDAAKAQLKLAESNVQIALEALKHTELRAPFAGILNDPSTSSAAALVGSAVALSSSRVELGAQVAIGTPLLDLIDNAVLHVEAAFDELDAGRLSIGMPAILTFDALPGVKLEGKVEALDPLFVKDAKGGRTRQVRIALPADSRLVVGMSVDIEIVVNRRDNILKLPSHLISGRGVKRKVWVIENGRAKQREIEVGLSGWTESEILSGLSSGEQVIASLDLEGLKEGVKVASNSSAQSLPASKP